jgi:hypothetical protein
VIDADALHLIVRQIRRDGRSRLQYVGESFPYTPAQSAAARATVEELAREEREAIARLIQFMHRNHVSPPVIGAFPGGYTTSNFVALEHLLPILKSEQEHAIAELEQSLAALPESEVRRRLWEYLEMKRRHLKALQSIGPV